MKILVTGAGGFAGKHLVSYLQTNKHQVWTPKIDLLNATDTESALNKIDPEGIIHLAATASVGESISSPAKILRNNILAELNLLESLRRKNSLSQILIICSADEYGKGSDQPIDENTPLMPINPYAVSKIGQDFLGLQYFLKYGMKIIRVRPFNHIGEGQNLGFVVPDFVKQIVDIEKTGPSGTITVGNLETIRDFTDVKDMVCAYELALVKGVPGEVYNLGSGKETKIKDLLNTLIGMSKSKITTKANPLLFRSGEQTKLVCNPDKFYQLTGWKAQIPLEETLKRVLEWWRKQ